MSQTGIFWNNNCKLSMERLFIITPGLLALFFSLLAPQTVSAAAWQWKLNLQSPVLENAMIMPSSLMIDSVKERYYVVDSGNNRLLSFDKEGKLLSAFNAGGSLQTPYDLVRDESGDLWVVEKGRNSLTHVNMQKKDVTNHIITYGGKAVFPDRLEYDEGVFYLLDKGKGIVLAVDKNMKVTQQFICPDCENGGFVDFKLQSNKVLALAMLNKTIYNFAADGRVTDKIILKDKARFPVSFAMDPAGPIYVLERHAGQVAVYDAKGSFKYTFLGPGQIQGQLYFPTELRFDSWGQLCIVDEGNGRVQVFGRN